MTTPRFRIGLALATLAVTALALSSVRHDTPSGTGLVSTFVLLMLCPGAALYFFFETRPRLIESLAAATLLSPVVVAALGAALLRAGIMANSAAAAVCLLCSVLTLVAIYRSGPGVRSVTGRELLALGTLVVTLCVACGYLPFTEEWWRIRSDGWFHRGVIAQIADYGVPPGDPYFAGTELQYMWFYHAWNLIVSQAANVRPQWTMALFNTLSLVGLILTGFLFAGVFRDRFSDRMWSAATIPLGLSAAYWLFMPIRLGRAFTGEVRGWEEVKRQLSLSPLNVDTASEFMRVYFNPEFFLDKYIVPTAFSLGMSLYVFGWYASSAYFRDRRTSLLVLMAAAIIGMLGFHTLVGVVALVGALGGIGCCWLTRRRIRAYLLAPSLALGAVTLGAAATMLPYVYSITRLKEPSKVFPIGLSLEKTVGVIIGCALVGGLALFQRRFFRTTEMSNRYVLWATIAVTAFCLIAVLPGSNEYDKPAYFIFIPLAVIGGWTLADLSRRWSGKTRIWKMSLVALLCFAPANVLGFLGSYATPIPEEVSASEHRLAGWVRSNTSRDAVFIDEDNRIFLIAEGPRRYLYGRHAYARHWGYNVHSMAIRHHVRQNLYSTDAPLDANTLQSLGESPWPIYVIVRPPNAGANVDQYPRFFETVYAEDGLAITRVDRSACRIGASSGDFPRLTEESIVESSGLETEWR